MSNDIVAGVISPAVSALVAGVVAILAAWLKARTELRDREVRRHRALQQALEEVGLIDAWIKAHASVASPEAHERARQRAEEHLERAYSVLSEPVVAARSGVEEDRSKPDGVLTNLFLTGQARTLPAQAARGLYYLFLVLMVGIPWIAGAATVKPEDVTSSVVGAVLAVLVFGLTPTWLVRTLAVKLGRRGAVRSSGSDPAART